MRKALLLLLFYGAMCALTISCTSSLSEVSSNNSNQVGPPVQLNFQIEPSGSASAGINFGTMPVVQIEDSSGNVVTSAIEAVTLVAYTDSSCTTMAPGTFVVTNNTLTPTSGVASFTGVNYGGATTTIYIGASATGLAGACSNAIAITPGNPAKLIFSTEPADPSAVAGANLATQPAVSIEDAYGNVVTSASNSIQLKPYTDSACTSAGSGTFNATTNPVTPSSGVATFGGVNYTKSGTFYVGASSSGLTGVCSNAISVAAGPPAKLVWVSTPSSSVVNGCFNFSIGVQDTYGNTAMATGSAITVNLVPGGSAVFYSDSGCTASTSTATISIGQSNTGTFYGSDSVVEIESEYATATGLTNASSTNQDWVLYANGSFSPTTFTAGTCVPFTVTTKDAKGNVTAVTANSQFWISGNAGTISGLYSDSGCTVSVNWYGTVSSGQSSVTYYFKDDEAESLTPSVSSSATDLFWNSSATPATVTPNTPADLIITGPTFEPPSTCAGPYTVTSRDQYGNVSSITGTALTVNLNATGSARFYGNSSCSLPSISNVSIGIGSSSQTFYVEDTATESSTLTASGTSFTSGNFNLDSTATSLLQQVAIGGKFICVLINGGVKCWGGNDDGELGNGTTTSSLQPVSVSGLSSGVQSIVAGSDNYGLGYACAIKTDHTVWCWGSAGDGEFQASTNTQTTPYEQMLGGSPFAASQMSASFEDVCAVATSGALYCWGQDFGGSTPTQILTSGAISVSVSGYYHYCVTLTGGDLKCWGKNSAGAIGDGNYVDIWTPTQVVGLTSGISGVAANPYSTCSVNTSGAVQCWGDNTAGELATGTTGGKTDTPGSASSPLSSGVSSVVGGGSGTYYGYSCAVMTSGALYCWGDEYNGELGNGVSSIGGVGTPQSIFSAGVTSAAATPNLANTCAIVSGNLECWGYGGRGQLGAGTYGSSSLPIYSQSLE